MAEHLSLNKLLHNLNEHEFLKDIRLTRINIYEILTLANSGCDVTSALPTLVKLLAIGDTFVKRVAGEIITVLAAQNPEMVMLATNTLVQDCKDVNPVIRSLGLRILGSLRSESSVEMLNSLVMQGLEDSSPQVRKQAALTSVVLHQMAPSVVMEGGIWDSLYGHLSDPDSATVASCLCALEEIFVQEKGTVVSNKLGQYLISKMYSFTPCVQRYILQFLLKYSPKSKSLVFEHLNALDSSLTAGASLAITLSTLELFCHLTADIPKVKLKAYATGWNTLKLYLTRERNEEMVTAIIDYLCRTSFPVEVIREDFSKFFCRDDDAQFLMQQKIKMLCKLLTTENSEHILEDLLLISRRLEIDALKKMIWYLTEAVSLQPDLEQSYVSFLQRLIQLGGIGVTDCVIQVLSKVKFYDQNNWLLLLPNLQNHYQEVNTPTGKVALLEVIKSQGDHMVNASDILEKMMEDLDNDEEDGQRNNSPTQVKDRLCHSKQIKISLLNAMVKMCLRSPAKIQPLLARFLENCLCDKDRNVRDRALFLYGFLQSKVLALTKKHILSTS